jgi:hypothetical protein
MFGFRQKALIYAVLIGLFSAGHILAQTAMVDEVVTQEVSEQDGIPVIVKHLPDWEKVKDRAVFVSNAEAFSKAAGDQPLALAVSFAPGTEAAVADYDAGKLAIVEFTSPQVATEADAVIQSRLGEAAGSGQSIPVYRRVGNYAVFVFNPKDESSANALIDQVKYEKVVQWLGKNPYAQQKAERYYIETTSDVVINSIRMTGVILLFALIIGGTTGVMIFRSRNRQRLHADAYTDAGGMVRLNLDELSAQTSPDRLLDSK